MCRSRIALTCVLVVALLAASGGGVADAGMSRASAPVTQSRVVVPDGVAETIAGLAITSHLPNGVDTSVRLVTPDEIAAACTGTLPSGPAVLCVSATSAGATHRRIQAAIDASKNGDLIKVATGSYVENIDLGAKAIKLQAGYGQGFTSRQSDPQLTRIQASGSGSVVTITDADGALVDGFDISGGTGTAYGSGPYCRGGGIFVHYGRATLSGNLVHDNSLCNDRSRESRGGGIHTASADVQLVRNIVKDNVGGFGGGAMISGGTAYLLENQFVGNATHADHGGGLMLASANSIVRDTLVQGNRVAASYGWGGGVIVIGGAAHIEGARVFGNYAPSRGAAVDSDEGAWVLLEHSLIVENHTNGCSEQGGSGAYTSGPSSTLIVLGSTVAFNRCGGTSGGNGFYSNNESNLGAVINSILWENRTSQAAAPDELEYGGTDTMHVLFSDLLQPFAGPGNVSVDPLFAAPGDGDFALQPASPLIGAGVPLVGYLVAPDGPATDIGWSETSGPSPALAIGDVAVTEGGSGVSQASFTVTLPR